MQNIRLVYFDVGGTILTVEPSVGEIYAEAAARLGFAVDHRTVSANFRAAWQQSLERRRLKGYSCDDAFLREEWCRIVIDSFAGMMPEEAARSAFDDLYERFCRADAWKLAPGARETFEELVGRGIRIGLLSNWDSRLEETLRQIGVLHHFDPRVISCQIGVEKPHPAIFKEAVRRAGVPAAEIVHVGDSYEWDIAPARAIGMRAVWVTREEGGSAQADGRVGSFREVLGVIRRWIEPRTAWGPGAE